MAPRATRTTFPLTLGVRGLGTPPYGQSGSGWARALRIRRRHARGRAGPRAPVVPPERSEVALDSRHGAGVRSELLGGAGSETRVRCATIALDPDTSAVIPEAQASVYTRFRARRFSPLVLRYLAGF